MAHPIASTAAIATTTTRIVLMIPMTTQTAMAATATSTKPAIMRRKTGERDRSASNSFLIQEP